MFTQPAASNGIGIYLREHIHTTRLFSCDPPFPRYYSSKSLRYVVSGSMNIIRYNTATVTAAAAAAASEDDDDVYSHQSACYI